MVWPARWMIRRFVRDHQNTGDPRVRLGHARLEAWTSIAGNLLLGAAKLVLGLVANSVALTADAFHSFGDMLSSAVLLVSMKVAASPADRKHPHGHGRAEALGTLVLAALLLVTAVEFGHQGWHRLSAPEPVMLGWAMVPVLLVFWGAKEWMARFSAELGRAVSSEALAADAVHHRSDAWSTLLVVLAFVGAELGRPGLDGLFALGVAAIIAWTGLRLAWGMMSRLMGEAPAEGLVAGIVSAAASVRGVRGVHGIEVHDYGQHKVASLHVEVAARLATAESHALATLVEEAVRRRLGLSAVVHVEASAEPPPRRGPAAAEVEAALREFAESESSVRSFHAVHVFSSGRQLSVDLHLTVEPALPVEECHRLEHAVGELLRGRLGAAAAVNVHCEPEKLPRGAG